MKKRERIAAGIPVIVGGNDWGGHWQVIIGYDTMGTEYDGKRYECTLFASFSIVK